MDGGDEAVVVARDVKNGDGLGASDGGEVGLRKDFANVGDGLPLGGGGHGEPRGKVGGRVRMVLGIVEDAALGDDSHSTLLSN